MISGLGPLRANATREDVRGCDETIEIRESAAGQALSALVHCAAALSSSSVLTTVAPAFWRSRARCKTRTIVDNRLTGRIHGSVSDQLCYLADFAGSRTACHLDDRLCRFYVDFAYYSAALPHHLLKTSH